MRKMLLCMGVALATTISIGHAQTLQSLKDSCYHYLAIQDIASFNATYIQLPDALEKEMNPEVFGKRAETDAERRSGYPLVVDRCVKEIR